VYLLPYMEQDNVYTNFNINPAFALWYQNSLNRPASTGTMTIPRPPNLYGAEPNIKSLLCPSSPAPGEYQTVLMGVYYGTAGVDYPAGFTGGSSHVFSSEPGGIVLGRSNYLGMGGYYAQSVYGSWAAGIFTYNTQVSLANVSHLDGTSETVMFGEYAGGFNVWNGSGGIPDGIMGASWVCGFNYSGFGPPTSGQVSNPNVSNWAYFSSQHSNIVNFCFADGSVRSISTTISFTPWVYLTGYQDGVIIEL